MTISVANGRQSAVVLRAEAMLMAGLLAVLAVSAAYRSAWLPNHDASWFAYVAAHLQDGVSFYDRFVDPNWPMAAYAMAPAGFLWRHGVDMGFAINAQSHLVAALSLLLSLRLLQHGDLDPLRRAGLLAAFALAELALPGADFGQREHLFVMLLLPYLVLAGLRLEGLAVRLPLALAVGAAAGLGTSIKPMFVLLPLAAEAAGLALIRRPRWLLRPEAFALFGCVGAGAALMVALFPEYLRVLRWAVSLYSAYRSAEAPVGMATLSALCLAPALLALVLGPARPTLAVGTASLLGGLVVYWLQAKGWLYQLLPAIVLAAALPGYLLAHARTLPRAALATVLCLFPVFVWSKGDAPVAATSMAPLQDVLSAHEGSFYALSVGVTPYFPAGPLLRKEWAGRANCLFLLPGIRRAETEEAAGQAPVPAEVNEAREWLRRSVTEDILRNRPAVILVEPMITSDAFDILGWFLQSPDFHAAWQAYAPDGSIGDITVFRRL